MKRIYLYIIILVTILFPSFSQSSEMIFVEGGTFQMGNENGASDSNPIHNVRLDSFYMDKYKVLLSDWVQIMGQMPCDYVSWGIPSPGQMNKVAVMGVNWYEALIYCNRRSVLEGLDPCYSANGSKDAITYQLWDPKINKFGLKTNLYLFTNVECDWNANGYRLPTEAEWEYAARGGKNNDGFRYSGSDDYTEVINYLDDEYRIGIKKPNSLGFYDMSMGPEWCWDLYKSDYYASCEKNNPRGPVLGDKKEVIRSIRINEKAEKVTTCRVMRGGDYFRCQIKELAVDNSVYSRSYNDPENYDTGVGLSSLFMFRVVRNARNYNQKKNIIIKRDVEVKITGIPYYYFMTDDYNVLRAELASYNCRAPKLNDLKKNYSLAKSVRDTMIKEGCCWSLTVSGDIWVLHYYTSEEGPYSVYLKDLKD